MLDADGKEVTAKSRSTRSVSRRSDPARGQVTGSRASQSPSREGKETQTMAAKKKKGRKKAAKKTAKKATKKRSKKRASRKK